MIFWQKYNSNYFIFALKKKKIALASKQYQSQ